ncbi:hypothetical protein EDB89DRAFT_2084844 [Lactarius sanguifluus]|nr:hypothetical protein EDB89DRAFT_2084844 [Lactarius sanguifluus]
MNTPSALMDIFGCSRRMGTGEYMALPEQHSENFLLNPYIFLPTLALSTSVVETTFQPPTLMFTSRASRLSPSLLTLAVLLYLSLPAVLLLLPALLLLPSDLLSRVPLLVEFTVSSITLGLTSTSGWGWNSWGAGFLLPDLTLNRAYGHGYWSTLMTAERQHGRRQQGNTDSCKRRQQGSIDGDGDGRWRWNDERVGLGSRGSDSDSDDDDDQDDDDEMAHQRRRDGAYKCSPAKTKWNTSLQLEDSKLGRVDMCTGSWSQATARGNKYL